MATESTITAECARRVSFNSLALIPPEAYWEENGSWGTPSDSRQELLLHLFDPAPGRPSRSALPTGILGDLSLFRLNDGGLLGGR